ncbi:MAG: CPBP family intramembrane glutamic endopeptidase [Alphaproteobacteria bacterium]
MSLGQQPGEDLPPGAGRASGWPASPPPPPARFGATARDIWHFLCHPTPVRYAARPAKRFRILLRCLLIAAGLILLLSPAIYGVLEQLGGYEHSVEKLFEAGDSLLLLFALAVVLVPVVEETVFRLYVARFHPIFIVISLAGGLVTAAMLEAMAVLMILAVLLGFLVAGLLRGQRERLGAWWTRHFRWIVYASALVFGLVHLANFVFPEDQAVPAAIKLVLVTPQILMGLFLAYMRVRHGLVWSMLLHGSYNGLLLGLGLVFYDLTEGALSPSAG